jgi:hypothetical protein
MDIKSKAASPSSGRVLCLLRPSIGLFAFILLIGCRSYSTTTTTQPATGATAKPSVPASTMNTSSAPSATPESNWDYRSSEDEMTSVVSKIACVYSSNELSFDAPYDGGSKGSLCLRKKGKQLNAWVSISSGQFQCGIEDCILHLKFDNGSIQSFSAVEPESHESNMLFIEPESRLLVGLMKAKTLKLEATYFEEGRRVLAFEVSGLDKTKLD